MIGIAELDAFGAGAVEACAGLEEHILISSEAEMKDLLQTVKVWPLLVCVYPSSDGDDVNSDNYAERNTGLFYVVAPMREKFSRAERTALWQKTQDGMNELKQFIRDAMANQDHEFFEMMSDADFGKRSIEPEYNLLGCTGWSLLFNYTV